MTKENIKKSLTYSWKKSVFCQILQQKICILPKYKGKKSVYTDKISMSGRSVFMNAIIKMGKPLALISTLHSRKAFSFI